MMLDSQSRLRDFPSLAEMTYLNTAAEGIPPLVVGEALTHYFRDHQQGMDGRIAHFAKLQSTKELVGQLFGLSGDEVAICSCTSEAYNLAALALRLQPGDEVVINDLDFPAGATPWLQHGSPATVKIWRSRQGALRVDDLIPLLSSRTRLVTSSLVSFFNGFMIPLPAVAEAVHTYSPALFALDVTQALGRVPLQLVDVDLVISSTHKWILASHGGGLVGVPVSRAADWTVPAGGWFNLQNSMPLGPGRLDPVESLPGAASFAVGMPNFPAIYAIHAALTYITQVGVEAINAATRPLVWRCLEGLSQLPVELLTPLENDALAGIVAFRHPQMEAIQQRLHTAGIHVMAQAGRMRIALHGYNRSEDVELLLQTLEEVLSDVTAR